jgi:hypothetical protein
MKRAPAVTKGVSIGSETLPVLPRQSYGHQLRLLITKVKRGVDGFIV